jgi:predicted ATPase/DNA-binding winged helix-turn-helix (wHTH) protein/Flp pilus assembly protein TadD
MPLSPPADKTDAMRFGRIEIRPHKRELLVNGEQVAIGSRAYDLLHVLAERTGQLLTKTQLLDLVWPDVVVEENNLQVQVSSLRRILGSEAIATVPGRGYRFTLTLQQGDAVSSTPHPRVSAQASPLYGRADDLSALCRLIEQHALITIVGPGGIGKTRLAEAVMHELRDRIPKRVLVDLAPLTDPASVIATIARALGLGSEDGQAALDLIVYALAGTRILLVLDNCEHLLDAVDETVAAIRKGAPEVQILATSQELLRHPDEHVYRLGPLPLPADTLISSAREAGAVELFVARAQAVAPRFVLVHENVATVVEICRRLDGIPLAIELAAARVPLLGVEGVRERLNERFRLLTAGSRLALRRHQTLRAALEWSYSLLSEPEQAVFDRLGVFVGSFSLESAQKLAADDRMDGWAVLDHLGGLIDKSMVVVDDGDVARYRMLETTRAFALERLSACGATSQTLRRHAEVLLEIFEGFYLELLNGTPSVKVTESIGLDIDDLHGALRWAGAKDGSPGIAIALFGAAMAGHYQGFYASQVRDSMETLRGLVDDSIPAIHAARFWLACAEWGALHAPIAAIDDGKRALALYRDLGIGLGSSQSWNVLAYSLMTTGQMVEARHAMEEALRLRDPTWPLWHHGVLDNMASLVLAALDELSAARLHAVAFLDVCRQVSGDVDECTALSILIALDIALGDYQQAAATADELLGNHPAIWAQTQDGRCLRDVATALLCVDRLDEAEPLYREALARVRMNYGSGASVFYDLAMFIALRGRLEDAARVFSYAECAHAARHTSLRPVARQLRERLLTLFGAELAPDPLSRLYEEGKKMTDDEVCALVFKVETDRTKRRVAQHTGAV